MKIQFTYNGTPVGKGRPRASKDRSGNIHMYTPKTTADFEKQITLAYNKKYPGLQFTEDDILTMELLIKMPIPKSFTKKQKQQALSGELLPAKKPDCDNIIKIVCDSLNSVCYPDDRQIVSITAQKIYSDEPGIDITVSVVNR